MVVDSLIETGWIDETEDGFVIHDWEIWQEQWYKAKERRENDAKRKRESRKQDVGVEKSEEAEPKVNASVKQAVPKETENKYSVPFEAFWELYPRKIGKGEAYKKYMARRKDGYTDEELIGAAKNYSDFCKKMKTEQQYIKHARTFLSENTPFVDYMDKKKQQEEIIKEKGSNPYDEWGA